MSLRGGPLRMHEEPTIGVLPSFHSLTGGSADRIVLRQRIYICRRHPSFLIGIVTGCMKHFLRGHSALLSLISQYAHRCRTFTDVFSISGQGKRFILLSTDEAPAAGALP